MSERVNRKRSLVAGVLCGLVGALSGFALCVLLAHPADGDWNIRHVREVNVTPLPVASSPRLSDVPRVHDLTVEDLTRCHHLLFGRVLPDPLVPGVATVASSEPLKTTYSDDDLRLCVSTLNSLAGIGNGE
jgi:hypothetical protein